MWKIFAQLLKNVFIKKKTRKKIRKTNFKIHFLSNFWGLRSALTPNMAIWRAIFVHNRKKIFKFFPQNFCLDFSCIYQRIAPWKFFDQPITISCQYRLIFSKKAFFKTEFSKRCSKYAIFVTIGSQESSLFHLKFNSG